MEEGRQVWKRWRQQIVLEPEQQAFTVQANGWDADQFDPQGWELKSAVRWHNGTMERIY